LKSTVDLLQDAAQKLKIGGPMIEDRHFWGK
jgi:hypothetical protein